MSAAVHSKGKPTAIRYSAVSDSVRMVASEIVSTTQIQSGWKSLLRRYGTTVAFSVAFVVLLIFALKERSARQEVVAALEERDNGFNGRMEYMSNQLQHMYRDHWHPNTTMSGTELTKVENARYLNGNVAVTTEGGTIVYVTTDNFYLERTRWLPPSIMDAFDNIDGKFMMTKLKDKTGHWHDIHYKSLELLSLETEYPKLVAEITSSSRITNALTFSKGVALITKTFSSSIVEIHLIKGSSTQLLTTIPFNRKLTPKMSSNGNLIYYPEQYSDILYQYNAYKNTSVRLIETMIYSPQVLINAEGTSVALFENGRLRVMDFKAHFLRIDKSLPSFHGQKLLAFSDRYFAFSTNPCHVLTPCNIHITIMTSDPVHGTLKTAKDIVESAHFFEDSASFRLVRDSLYFHYVTTNGVYKLEPVN